MYRLTNIEHGTVWGSEHDIVLSLGWSTTANKTLTTHTSQGPEVSCAGQHGCVKSYATTQNDARRKMTERRATGGDEHERARRRVGKFAVDRSRVCARDTDGKTSSFDLW